MKDLVSINPSTGQIISIRKQISDKELHDKLNTAYLAYQSWRLLGIKDRVEYVNRFIKLLEESKNEAANLITLEMGKPLRQSLGEIEKCIWMARIYSQDIFELIHDEEISTNFKKSYITFEPLGPILAIMPWNFPFWQVLRFAIPNIILGNVVLLKHSSNVQGCAEFIEMLFDKANFPQKVLQNLAISSDRVESVISSPYVKGVTLTGSDKAGSAVASIAGKEIKKTVMELGGSDPFLILSDVDVRPVCQNAVNARIRNAGQACTSPKRFIIMRDIYEDFVQTYVDFFSQLKVGDPFEEDVDVGPLSSQDALQSLHNQVLKSLEMGASLKYGGFIVNRPGFFYMPTVVTDVTKGMPLYDEEVFGPVAVFIEVNSIEEMIKVANDTQYGLAASIWTKNVDEALRIANLLEVGNVYINAVPSSDPRMPFGGVKKSGYGRELSKYGLMEFLNIKSVLIN